MADLKLVYKADTEDLALTALDDLEEKWGKKYPASQSFPCVFLQAAEISVFSKVRVCEAQRSNESPSGAFKRQNGLA